MRQYAGFSTAKESNARYRYLLEQGQTGLSVAFDLPTQMGYDSDAPEAEGEVGRVGVAIDSLADMEQLFDGIPLDKVSTSMTINSTAPILLALYVAVAERQGVSRAALSGTTQNDLLKEYIARGTYIYPPTPSLRLITDVVEWSSAELPKWNTISISGYHMRETGDAGGCDCATTLLLLCGVDRHPGGDGKVPRSTAHLGTHHEGAIRRDEREVAALPVPRSDGGVRTYRAIH
jgi:methylmalonyl-CoA mutase N-terminal domain/subunit